MNDAEKYLASAVYEWFWLPAIEKQKEAETWFRGPFINRIPTWQELDCFCCHYPTFIYYCFALKLYFLIPEHIRTYFYLVDPRSLNGRDQRNSNPTS